MPSRNDSKMPSFTYCVSDVSRNTWGATLTAPSSTSVMTFWRSKISGVTGDERDERDELVQLPVVNGVITYNPHK